jgi:hypothetical protein
MKADIYLTKSEVITLIRKNLEHLIPGIKGSTILRASIEIDKYSREYCTITISDEKEPT